MHLLYLTLIKPISKESIVEWASCQCNVIFGAIMNFLVFLHYALIISKFFHLPFFELIKDEARYPNGMVFGFTVDELGGF
jgi:hypothetical protein